MKVGNLDGRMVVRLTHPIDDAALATINEEFADIVAGGTIEPCEPFPVEIDDRDQVELPRLVFTFDQRHFARLHRFARRLSDF